MDERHLPSPVLRLEKSVIPQSPGKRASWSQPRKGECCAGHHLHGVLGLGFQKPRAAFTMFLSKADRADSPPPGGMLRSGLPSLADRRGGQEIGIKCRPGGEESPRTFPHAVPSVQNACPATRLPCPGSWGAPDGAGGSQGNHWFISVSPSHPGVHDLAFPDLGFHCL